MLTEPRLEAQEINFVADFFYKIFPRVYVGSCSFIKRRQHSLLCCLIVVYTVSMYVSYLLVMVTRYGFEESNKLIYDLEEQMMKRRNKTTSLLQNILAFVHP